MRHTTPMPRPTTIAINHRLTVQLRTLWASTWHIHGLARGPLADQLIRSVVEQELLALPPSTIPGTVRPPADFGHRAIPGYNVALQPHTLELCASLARVFRITTNARGTPKVVTGAMVARWALKRGLDALEKTVAQDARYQALCEPCPDDDEPS